MKNLLLIRERIRRFYGKYEAFITPVLKFLLAFVALLMINSSLGFMEKIDSVLLVLIVALLCSFLPAGFTVLFCAIFVLLHFYALGLEIAAIGAAIFLIMFVLYFRFSPRDTVVILLTPVLFVLKVPYFIPLAMGLIGTPVSVVSVSCGVILYYFIHYISVNALSLKAMEAEDMMARIRLVIDSILNNREMLVAVVAFAVTLVVVYAIRKLAVDHSWVIAMVAGTITDIVIFMIGDLIFDTNVSILWLVFGSVLSLVAAKILQFFVFNVDYSRTERVQFEDDEYYYYVKAVPKVNLAVPEKTVKQINKRTREPGNPGTGEKSGREGSDRTVTVEHTGLYGQEEDTF